MNRLANAPNPDFFTEELTSELSTVEVKMACVGFVRDLNANSHPSAAEVVIYAEKLFEWITKKDD